MTILSMRKGAVIRYAGQSMRLVASKSFDTVVLRSADGQMFNAAISDLEAEAAGAEPAKIVSIDVKRQQKVPAWVAVLKPLIDKDRRTRTEVKEAGKALGRSSSTIYAALSRYDGAGTVDVLPPPTRNGGAGKSRIHAAAEKVITEAIDEIVLNRRNYQASHFYEVVKDRLEKKGYVVSHSTLASRLAAIPDDKLKRAQLGHSEAKRLLDPLRGSHPDALRPFAEVQADHWKADIEIVSDDRLTVIGRVWITLAIDIYSRMVCGVHVGLDEPSTTTIGMMMINLMTRKDASFARLGIEGGYNPASGQIERLGLDNAGEFTGQSMRNSCQHHNIDLKWRPIDHPQYGAHIERLNGTLAALFKALPGATGSTTVERKKFKPGETAAMTLEDVTRHVLLLIEKYHREIHLGIGMTPLDKFESYYFGPEGQKHRLPDVQVDNQEFRMTWYPFERRTVQRYGIRIDHLEYYGPVIRGLVKNRAKHGKLEIRRDPFDVRVIYLNHPVAEHWVPVPLRCPGFPVASIFELREAKREALRLKRRPTPANLSAIVAKLRENVEQAKKKTRSAERAETRRNHHDRIRKEPVKNAQADTGAKPVLAIVTEIDSSPALPRARTEQPAAARPPFSGQNPSRVRPTLTDEDIDACFDD